MTETDTSPPSLSQRQRQAIASVCRMIEQAAQMPTLEQMAAVAHLSRYHFQRLFKKALGISPKAYWEAQRQQRIRTLLPESDSVTEAVYASGYNSGARFYATAAKTLGMKPADFKAGGPGHEIHFAIGKCSLGEILVAATERGVCAISLGDDPQRLLDELQQRFSHASLRGADSDFEQVVARVVGFVEQTETALDLPLDLSLIHI